MSKMRLSYGRLSGFHAGQKSTSVWVCSRPGCEVHHAGRKPEFCMKCHGMTFDYFASGGEAARWASLRLLETVGKITNLRRQVRIPLLARAPNGLDVHVADYVADYVYDRDGEEVVEDHKPRAGMDDVAKLKLKWVAAQRGKPVAIYSS